jgi:hypothetical protein
MSNMAQVEGSGAAKAETAVALKAAETGVSRNA